MIEFEAIESRNSLVGWCSLLYSLTNQCLNLQEEKFVFVLLKSYQVVD